jgi:hypothetical protein
VAVRYETHGCDVSLELLPDCIGPKNKYVYVPFNASDTKIARDPNELFAQLPLGAANLTGLLKERRALRTDFKLVGSVGLPDGSTVSEYDLVGPECKRATHIVRAVFVGGFSMAAADPSQVSATGNLFSRGDPVGEPVAREGYPAICDRAEAEGIELGGCSAPLRIALIALGKTSPAPATAKAAPPPSSEPSTEATAELADGGKPTFDQASVERVTRQHLTAVRRGCWESTTESLKRITVSVSLRVDVQGRVPFAEAHVVDSEGPPDVASVVARCIANDVRGWTVPDPDSEKALTLPFHLLRQ